MKRLLYFISGLCLLGGMTACEERIENVPAGSKDQIVDVSLSVDFAPETDAYTLETPTKANWVSMILVLLVGKFLEIVTIRDYFHRKNIFIMMIYS